MGNRLDDADDIATSAGASRDTLGDIAAEHPCLAVLLKEVRRKSGMSQRELSRRSGLSQPRICALEAGAEGLMSSYDRLFEALGARLSFHVRRALTWDAVQAELADERRLAEEHRCAVRYERTIRRRRERR